MPTTGGGGTFSEIAACGLGLRSEDPESMRDFILHLQKKTATVQEEASGKVPEAVGKVPEAMGAGSGNGSTGLSTRVWGLGF